MDNFDGYSKQEHILNISEQIINILKFVHSGRRAFNGIRPENVRIVIEEGHPIVHLIDFSEATKYVDETGHIGPNIAESNLQIKSIDHEFGSIQKLKQLKTARNDDLISLFYMIIHLANEDKIPYLEQIQN